MSYIMMKNLIAELGTSDNSSIKRRVNDGYRGRIYNNEEIIYTFAYTK